MGPRRCNRLGLHWGGVGVPRVPAGYCAFSPGGSLGPPMNGSCKVTAEGCNTDAECCDGVCDGYCQPKGCAIHGAPCTKTDDCCGLYLYGGFCQNGSCNYSGPAPGQ